MMLREGMFLADRYEIIEQIGTGGMADVYKAKCHKLNRYVAIKVMKSEFSQDKTFVSKFWAEAQSAAGLTNPNVVNVYDVGVENGIYYIVMELVEGVTLKKYIEKRGKLPYKEAVSIAIQVAKGMQAAHSHHIVHRDIKPQNIIISRDGKVKVTDFGIAKAASSSTITSSTMGSVHYISPEQARGGYSDERSDIYSFGITLFEMLTGTVPFDGDSTVSVAVQHIQEEIPKPSTVADGIPVSIDMIVLKCTQKKTERRYQDAAELIADLKKSLVAPDENFVKMMPVYNAPGQPETVQAAEESSENNDGQENQNSDESMAENKKDSEDIDDELLDDELLDDDDDEDEHHDHHHHDEEHHDEHHHHHHHYYPHYSGHGWGGGYWGGGHGWYGSSRRNPGIHAGRYTNSYGSSRPSRNNYVNSYDRNSRNSYVGNSRQNVRNSANSYRTATRNGSSSGRVVSGSDGVNSVRPNRSAIRTRTGATLSPSQAAGVRPGNSYSRPTEGRGSSYTRPSSTRRSVGNAAGSAYQRTGAASRGAYRNNSGVSNSRSSSYSRSSSPSRNSSSNSYRSSGTSSSRSSFSSGGGASRSSGGGVSRSSGGGRSRTR